jgi:tripeptidyl-peptidase-1
VGGGYEQAVSINISGYASGGGFSNISARPDWQWDAVAAYLNSSVKLPPTSYYNPMGRGAPDVSGIGHNALIVAGGGSFPVSGTSQSAPTVAAVFGLLQSTWFARTGSYFGFLNPLLYGIYRMSPEAFIDITVGDNICTESGCSASCTGYLCTPGWDPVTGLGSPNYPNLRAAMVKVADMVVARREAKAKKTASK